MNGEIGEGKMVLKFPGAWRFNPPPDGKYHNTEIPSEAVDEFSILVGKIAAQGDDEWGVYERFKVFYYGAIGTASNRSSSPGWAMTDLERAMSKAAKNAPLFIDAFYDACDALRRSEYAVPDYTFINDIFVKHNIGYVIDLPNLLLRETDEVVVRLPERPPTLDERAAEFFQASLQRSDDLLSEGRGIEAVQVLLLLFESVATAFRGIDTPVGTIEGKYFNKIARELREIGKGTALKQIIEWITSLHGFLSSPTGGGIRHGRDLTEGTDPNLDEARLYSNLIRSYLGYMLATHEKLIRESHNVA